MQLNKEQKEAVEYNNGPLLIIAGAGTGKTTVITEKIKYLVIKRKVKPENILALTFTEKAASEMEERIDKALPYGYFQMNISTFHSFADEILSTEVSHIGLDLGYKLLSEAESIIFLKDHLFDLKLSYFRPPTNPTKFLYALHQHFNRLQDEDISPKEYLDWVEKYTGEDKEMYAELSNCYKIYLDLKREEKVMEFSDLIYYLLRLFRKKKFILHKYRKIYPYLLVDEFQDTNIAQYNLIKLLSPPNEHSHLTIVGDDSQAIYKFRGASVSNILTFMRDYKDAKQVTLIKNYRSNQYILDAAYSLIRKNDPDTLEAQLGISKRLEQAREQNVKDEKPQFFLFQEDTDEADWVVNKIKELKKEGGINYSDIAILARSHKNLEPFIQTLSFNQIPFLIISNLALFKQPEIKDLIAYLQVLDDLSNSPALFRVLTLPNFKIDRVDLNLLMSFRKKTGFPLFKVLELYLFLSKHIPETSISNPHNYLKYIQLLKRDSYTKLKEIYTMLKRHLAKKKVLTAGQILYLFLEETGILREISNPQNAKQERKTENITKFFNLLKRYEQTNEDASVEKVVEYIEMSLQLKDSPLIHDIELPEVDAVNLLTVHAAKGLEYPVVFVVQMAAGRFPTYKRKETFEIPQELIREILPQKDWHLEEERRLCYVALTRSKHKLFLTSAKHYTSNKKLKKISPFVLETFGEEKIKKLKMFTSTQLSIFDTFKIEDKASLTRKSYGRPYPLELSFSEINTYIKCPLQYKYQYVLKIPTPPALSQTFGDIVHKTLQQFYLEYTKNKDVNKELLVKILNRNWLFFGFRDEKAGKLLKKRAEKMLLNFYKKFHKDKLNILDLERWFKIKLNENITIKGKIDRIDLLDNNELEIIDYKTGEKPKNSKRFDNDLQLPLYAYAASHPTLYNKPLEKIKLSYIYLPKGEKVTFKKKEEDIEKLKKIVIEVAEKIQKGEFSPTPSPFICDFCPFKIICDAWR